MFIRQFPHTNANKSIRHELENRVKDVKMNENMSTASDSLVMGLVHPTHFFAYRSLKHSRQ